MKITSLLITCLLGISIHDKYTAGDVLQLDVTDVLNARPVTIAANGKLITWTKGIDGDGAADGYLTQTAANLNEDINAHALPDSAVFPANTAHPLIVLHYANNDTLKNQARCIAGAGDFDLKLPEGNYSIIYLALTSSEGASPLKIQLNYVDGASYRDFLLPDYYQNLPPNDPNICYLVHDLAKWDNKNMMREKDHHNIDLLIVHPNPQRPLNSIKIRKGEAGYLVFWSATAVSAN